MTEEEGEQVEEALQEKKELKAPQEEKEEKETLNVALEARRQVSL